MHLIKSMATIAGFTAISRVAGFIRDILTAAFLGAGPVADAFFIALKLPNFFRRVTAEGAFSVAFVPIYMDELMQNGQHEANIFASRVFSLMLWCLSFFTILALIFMPYVIDLVAPGFSDDSVRFDLAVELSRITFPYLLLMSLTSLIGGIMNAHDHFGPFAFAPVLFNLSLIMALLFSGQFENAGYAMAWGVFVAGFLQLALLMVTAYTWIKIRLHMSWPRLTPRIKKLFKLMGPGVVGAGIVQINLFADMIIASFLPVGAISYLYYADRLNQLPLSTVGIAVGTALLPKLSKAISKKDQKEAQNLFNRSLEIVLFLGLPSALALFLLASPIISVLFERGEFGAYETQMTMNVLRGYVIGLPAYIAVKVFSVGFWAEQDTITPVKISVVTTLLNIAIALALIQFIGVIGIAVSTGIVAWVQLGLLAYKLRKNELMQFDVRFLKTLPKLLISTCIMGIVVYSAYIFFMDIQSYEHSFTKILSLASLVLLGLISYFFAVFMTGAIPLSTLKKYLLKRT